MITFQLRLKRISKPKHTKFKFDLEKLNDPNAVETFEAMIAGKFAPLTIMNDEDTDMDSMINTFNTAVTETASEILCENFHSKNKLTKRTTTLATAEIRDLCDKSRQLRKKRFEPDGSF